MMREKLPLLTIAFLSLIFTHLVLVTCEAQDIKSEAPLIYKVAFGSCAKQTHPLPIFYKIIEQKPDAFVFLGDNIYGDTNNIEVLKRKYKQLGDKDSYKHLKANTEILAIWDDHDYGRDDAGKNYRAKEKSKQVFLEFFEESKDSDRFKHEGIYTSEIRKVGNKTVQFLLLDTRTFRDDLIRFRPDFNKEVQKSVYKWRYSPHTDTTQTLLGEAQWKWLEGELSKPADFRILATSIQLGIEANGWEAWANFPHEQDRLTRLIKKIEANHLVAISGDIHFAEISKSKNPHSYPIFDITSSGLSQEWRVGTINKNRINGPIFDNNFGLLTIDFTADEPNVKAEIWDYKGKQRVEHTIPFKVISFPVSRQ